jgi:cytochrome c oxidase subunit 6a
VIPAVIIFSANAWTLWNEHWEHEKHSPPASERPQYPYLNIRNKPYPWGDGNKVSCMARRWASVPSSPRTWANLRQTLFWNDKVNYVKEE